MMMKSKTKMKQGRGVVLLLVSFMLLILLVGCSPTKEEGDASVVLTDMAGRIIQIDTPITHMVVLSPSDCEILYAIGAGDTLIGRGTYCDFPEEVLDKPDVASGAITNIEQIIALGPQVVLMNKMAQTEEQVALLEGAGIKCVVTDAQDIAGVYTAIELIGKVTGKEAESSALIEDMKRTFARIHGDSRGADSKTIYFEVSSLQWGDPWTAGRGTFMDEFATLLGLTNIFSDVNGWGEISQEQVIARNPDFIVTLEMYFGEGAKPEEEIMSRSGWQGIAAIQSGKVFNLDNNEISRPGPRLADAAVSLYNTIYGEHD
ncbi:MAG: ABC transporter substrate-binding protein [Peptococcaceae bacterium]|nr:ABC transporter substrate-binding protein [Peptococcaceae bacterium]